MSKAGSATALMEWGDRSTAAFLAAYRETMTHTALWPAIRGGGDGMLDFFLLEKSFYEIEYDLAQRPEWVRVPLNGMLRLLSRCTNESS